MSQLATGVPLRPSTPAPSGCVSGTNPLALKVVSTGAPSRAASASSSARADRAPWPTTNTGRSASTSSRAAAATSSVAGPVRPTEARPVGNAAGASEVSSCTSSGSTRCATPRWSTACLTASAASSAWSLPLWTTVDETVTSEKTAVRSRSWNAPRPQHLRRHLARDREHGRLVEAGVVQTGEEVGRARTGDRKARGRPAGQLPVGAGGERRGALVPDAEESELAALLGTAERVGETEVGVADHPEHGVHTMRDQGLDEDVGHRPDALRLVGEPHVGAVDAVIDVVRHDGVGESLWGSTREWVVVVAVPGTAKPAVLDGALAHRPALVRTAVLQGSQLAVAPGQCDRPAVDNGAPDPPLGGDVGCFDPVPRLPDALGLLADVCHGVTPFRLTRLCR